MEQFFYSLDLDLARGCTLEDIALILQEQNPSKIVSIIDATRLQIFEDNSYLPIACSLIDYRIEKGGIYTLRDIQLEGSTYTIFGAPRLEKILPDFLQKNPEYNPRTCNLLLDGRTVRVQKCDKKFSTLSVKSKTLTSLE
jgi:hypothetical protein